MNDNESKRRKNAGGDVGRTPGRAEGEEGGPPRSAPPNEPGKTPGRHNTMGEEFTDPGTARTPDPNVKQS